MRFQSILKLCEKDRNLELSERIENKVRKRGKKTEKVKRKKLQTTTLKCPPHSINKNHKNTK